MPAPFDPYHRWLGIPPPEQPPNHYRLLAVQPFEDNPDVIESAADQRMAHLRTFWTSKHGDLSQKPLNEVFGFAVRPGSGISERLLLADRRILNP